MLRLLFKPHAGGFFYHLRARRYSKKLWQPFRRSLEKVCLNFLPQTSTHGIFIGPSGGYCLTESIVSRFQKITVVDPDTSAEKIFRKNFPRAQNLEWLNRDAFDFSHGSQFSLLTALAVTHPDSYFIFCNVLGQMPFLNNSPFQHDNIAYRHWQADLRNFLKNKKWLSFHDRISGPPIKTQVHLVSASSLNNQQLVESADWQNKEVMDHWTQDLFPSGDRYYLSWNLSRGRSHIIEVVDSNSVR